MRCVIGPLRVGRAADNRQRIQARAHAHEANRTVLVIPVVPVVVHVSRVWLVILVIRIRQLGPSSGMDGPKVGFMD